MLPRRIFGNKCKLRAASCFARRTFSSKGSGEAGVVAIRREEYNVWERRAPLNPQHVSTLVREGYKVIVQPSTRRAYTMSEYEAAGALLQEDIECASVILGVKTLPPERLIPNRTYAFFSHTIKAQKAQMPLLDAIVQKNIRLVDYEKMLDTRGRRLVAFGQYAGITGMVNILHGLGLRLLVLGYHTPFLYIGNAHNYSSSSAARAAVNQLGREIQLGLLPESLGRIVFTFTGRGNVAQGAQNVFQELPNEYVSPSELQEVVESGDMRKVYGTVVSKEDYLEHIDGKKFDPTEFKAHPERYRSVFAEKIAPYTTVLVNGIYWEPGYPRLLTLDDMRRIQPRDYNVDFSIGVPDLPQKLLAICDISADIKGSVEFLRDYTTIDAPFMMYNAHTDEETYGE
jgi:alpha-aminoadipic semialdehyde synthase